MLSREVVAAVAAGTFHLYAVQRIEEAAELFTGIPTGERGADGKFPEGSLYGKTEATLRGYAETMREFGRWMEKKEGE